MAADEVRLRVVEFLKKNGTSFVDVPDSSMKQFEKTDKAIHKRLKTIAEAEETLKRSKINPYTIAADTGISRKTFYNNKLLGKYVEEYSTKYEKKTVSDELRRTKEKLDEAERQIRKLVLRDIDMEKLSYENMKLNNEIRNLEKRNHSLEKTNEKLTGEISVLKDKLSKHQVVLEFNQTSK